MQFLIFNFFFHSNFFGQTLSQNLMFSKLTGIWQRNSFLYAIYDFDICLFNVFPLKFFDKFGPSISYSKN